ncbi:hypothetical protein [Moorella sp. Hama-1]|uniref:hypothetical protein n=1 Tax=Moorella sp. Hama-1 TaxID=2138101 RepID=UPI000D65E70B|nr:hypothetical protein [Moorella sp. Hama-1]BCV21411.1 hypothetical protein hamaS1_14800 [Moorella sp. Hama-1]
MAKVLLDSTPLYSGELDDFTKALLPGLCRSMAISLMEDEAGNLILEPPLGNRTIVLRPLPGPKQELNLLLTTLSRELQGQGANVLIVPAAASDGQLFRLWQTQVLFAFSQNEASGTAPGLRFFYAPGKKEESLGLIAALVRAMLGSANPPVYTIPGPWEHFKNFRYRRLLNDTGVPSVLIEFRRVEFSSAFIHDLSAWLVNGLVQYFKKPVDEATMIKLQPLLRYLQDSLAPLGSPKGSPAGETSRGAGDLPVQASQAVTPVTGLMASRATGPADEARGVTPAPREAGVNAVRDVTAANPAGEYVALEEVTARDRHAGGNAPEEATPGDVTIKDSVAGEGSTGAIAAEEKEGTSTTLPEARTLTDATEGQGTGQQREELSGKAIASLATAGQDAVTGISPASVIVAVEKLDQSEVTDTQPARLQESPGINLPDQRDDRPSAAPASPPDTPPKPAPVQTTAAPSSSQAQSITTSGGTGLSRPARHRHRSNSFAPPGDGPVFVFQRPPEIAHFPSFFPQDVLERMAPVALQSTFLTGQQVKTAIPPGPAWQSPLQDQPALTAQEPAGRSDTLISQDPPSLSPEPAEGNLEQAKTVTQIPPNGDNDTALAELKRLSAAILAPELIAKPAREPQNGEAPSI